MAEFADGRLVKNRVAEPVCSCGAQALQSPLGEGLIPPDCEIEATNAL